MIALPEDVRQALKKLGLYTTDTRANRELATGLAGEQIDQPTAYQQLLLWSCSIGDEALLDIFWQRTRNPIKSAVLVGSICDELISIHEESMKKYDSWEERYPQCDQLIQNLSGISRKYRARASRLMASTFAADETKTGGRDPKFLGTDWAQGMTHNADWRRLLYVQLAFADNDNGDRETDSYVHPALRENTNDFWQSSGRYRFINAHIGEMLNKTAIIFFHYYIVCAHQSNVADTTLNTSAAGSEAGTRSDMEMLQALYPSELFLWLIHTAQSMELLLYRIDSRNHSRTAHSVRFDSYYLFFSQVAHTIRLLATLHWFMGANILYTTTALGLPSLSVLGSRVLTVAVLPGMISLLLSGFLLFPQARIGTVVEIYWDVVFSADNVAFILLMAAFCVAFSLTVGGVSPLDGETAFVPGQNEAELAEGPDERLDAAVGMINTAVSRSMAELLVPAGNYFSAALSVDEANSSTKDRPIEARVVFWLFWLLANTYLVQGFLVGIISENFIQKQQAAERLLLLQKLELIRCYIQREQGHISRIAWLPLPFNLPSTLYKLFYFTDISEITLYGWEVGKHLQRWPIIMAVASLHLEDDNVVGERTTRAAFRVLFRLLFFAVLLLVVICTGPILLLGFLGQKASVEMDPDWVFNEYGRRKNSVHDPDNNEQGRELEATALQQWQEFRDDAWNDSSQDVKVAARFEKLEQRFSEQEQAMAQVQRSLEKLLELQKIAKSKDE